jgi:hypothetical protein
MENMRVTPITIATTNGAVRSGMAERRGVLGVIEEIEHGTEEDMIVKYREEKGQAGQKLIKPRTEVIFYSVCDKRRQLREIIAGVHQGGLTQKNCRALAREWKGLGRLIRMGEVIEALEIDHRSLLKRCAEVNVQMPKTPSNRCSWERQLMARAEAAVPLVVSFPREARAAPAVEEGHMDDGGVIYGESLVEIGGSCKGECATESPAVWEVEGGSGEELPPAAAEERGVGPLQEAGRRLFPPTFDAREESGRGQAYEGDVSDAAALDAFGDGPIPRHLRMDKVRIVRDQNAKMRAALAECRRCNGELAEEVDRLGANDSRMRRELDRLKRDLDKWRTTASGLQSQLIEARAELSVKKDECERLREECRHLAATVDALNTPGGWRGVVTECRNENWRLKQELDFVKSDMNAKTDELAALREEVSKAKFAETNQQARAMQIEEELVRVREAAAWKESEEDAAFREALPFLFEHVKYLKDHCRKPFDKRRPYPGHCPYDSSRIHWRYYYLLCSTVGEHQCAYLVQVLGFPSWRTIQRWRQDCWTKCA